LIFKIIDVKKMFINNLLCLGYFDIGIFISKWLQEMNFLPLAGGASSLKYPIYTGMISDYLI